MSRTKLYVGGLSCNTIAKELNDLFSKYDETIEVNLVQDRKTGQSKGFAFISFSDSDSAKAALKLDEEIVDGKKIKVSMAKTDRERFIK